MYPLDYLNISHFVLMNLLIRPNDDRRGHKRTIKKMKILFEAISVEFCVRFNCNWKINEIADMISMKLPRQFNYSK